MTQLLENMPDDLLKQFKDEFAQEYIKRRFSYKLVRRPNEKVVSDLFETLVVYARKDNGV